MNELDIHLKLFANEPIEIKGIGQFQLPTIREVISMGYTSYLEKMSYLLFSKDSLEELNEEIENISDFELMINYNFHAENFRKALSLSFLFFFNNNHKTLDNGLIYFNNFEENTILTEEKWKLIQKIIRTAHFVPEKEEYVAGNDKAKKLIEKIMKNKKKNEKNQQEGKINLHSILSGIAWRTNGIGSLLDLTIYQLYDGYYRLGVIDNHNYTMTGIYTGNVDGSKIKLLDINWVNKININNQT
jgi:hypothetical protein